VRRRTDQKNNSGCILRLALIGLSGVCLIAGLYLWRYYRGGSTARPLPWFPTAAPYTPWPTPPVAETFGFPLLPAESYGPYVQGVTGPLPVDTRYGVQNPAQGGRSNCFRDASGGTVPFGQLYHAGVDLFALNEAGQVAWGEAQHAPVHAVADGVVVFTLDAGADGHIVATEHRLADGRAVYAVYWHVDYEPVQVREGQPVSRGQVIAVVADRGLNSHLHWEMRTFRDGSRLFPAGTAGERGTCNGYLAGVGYTWDDDPARAHPDFYGYLDPISFVEAHSP
jgi:murein DD-endopeptidase MepM/ murein hydrolase activator NlpD